ncbi:hypothetical protein D3C80_1538360 [compost metagenome]
MLNVLRGRSTSGFKIFGLHPSLCSITINTGSPISMLKREKSISNAEMAVPPGKISPLTVTFVAQKPKPSPSSGF